MKLESKTVHAGDRKRPKKGASPAIPVTTPIFTATSYIYESMEQLDRVFGREEAGPSYARYDNPTNTALQDLLNELEGGHGAFVCSSGMMAMHIALLAALLDRPKRIVASHMLYGATTHMLMTVFGALGFETTFVDVCDLAAFQAAMEEVKPGAVVVESVSNPLLRVCAIDRVCEIAKRANAPVIVDNTFATPLLMRPLELGASMSVHSTTKFLNGHGDALGGAIITDKEHFEPLTMLTRTLGPNLGPFEAYMTMRGVKTFAVRMEKQCANACRLASWLAAHPKVQGVNFPGDPAHPDSAAIKRLFPAKLFGAMISFVLRGGREEVFAFMEKLKLVVPATSLGDVHTMILYPAMSSHRDLSPKHRERLGIGNSLVRISAGIEAVEDVIEDLEQALA